MPYKIVLLLIIMLLLFFAGAAVAFADDVNDGVAIVVADDDYVAADDNRKLKTDGDQKSQSCEISASRACSFRQSNVNPKRANQLHLQTYKHIIHII